MPNSVQFNDSSASGSLTTTPSADTFSLAGWLWIETQPNEVTSRVLFSVGDVGGNGWRFRITNNAWQIAYVGLGAHSYSSAPSLQGKWSHVVIRKGSASFPELFIDGASVARSGGDSLNAPNAPSADFEIVPASQFGKVRTTEFTLYNAVLTDTDVALLYGSGKPTRDITASITPIDRWPLVSDLSETINSPGDDLTATGNVAFSQSIDNPFGTGITGLPPTSAGLLRYLFQPIDEGRPTADTDTVWNSDVRESLDVSEQRTRKWGSPQHRTRLYARAFGPEEDIALRMMMARTGTQRFYAPLFSDESQLTSSASQGATVINCATEDYRFSVGKKVVIYTKALVVGEFPTFELATIQMVGASSLTLTAPTVNAYTTPFSYVAPVFVAEMVLAANGESVHLGESRFELIAEEVVDSDMILPTQTPGTTPAGVTEYKGHPILDLDAIRTKGGEFGLIRKGSILRQGNGGAIPFIYGDRLRYQEGVGLEFHSRSDAFDFIRLADSRAGRAHPFWALSPSMAYTPVSVDPGGSTATIRAAGDIEDWPYRPTVGIRLTDGSIQIRDVISVVRNGDNDEITFDAALSPVPQLNEIERIAPAALWRFDRDYVPEQWQTHELMRSEIELVELIREVDVSIADFTKIATVALTTAFTAGNCPGAELPECQECTTTIQPVGLGTFCSEYTVTLVKGIEVPFNGLCHFVDGSPTDYSARFELFDSLESISPVVTTNPDVNFDWTGESAEEYSFLRVTYSNTTCTDPALSTFNTNEPLTITIALSQPNGMPVQASVQIKADGGFVDLILFRWAGTFEDMLCKELTNQASPDQTFTAGPFGYGGDIGQNGSLFISPK